MSDTICWRVVGGADKGGILVRAGKDLSSAQEGERLSTGAVVKQLALEGDRLHFERIEGTGPATGWVSLKLKDKDLLVHTEETSQAMAAIAAEAARYRIRWAVNIDDWNPKGEENGDEFTFLLSLIEPEEERTLVTKYKLWPDKKRAMASRLLMRQSSATVLGLTSFQNVQISRTKGKKPFLASPLPPENEAPNWNANPSHEGSWVLCASEPYCLCGVDVAELRRLKPNGEAIDFYKVFADQLTQLEWDDVKRGGESLDDQYEVFARYWSAKEAFSKARGDGMGFPFQKCEFQWSQLAGHPDKTAYAGTVKVDGALLPLWRLIQHKMPTERPHWVTVARGPLTDIVDAKGEFTNTLRKKQTAFTSAAWKDVLNDDSPAFEVLPFSALVPPDAMDEYVKAGGSPLVSA